MQNMTCEARMQNMTCEARMQNMTEVNFEDVYKYTQLFINNYCTLDKRLLTTGDDLRYAWFGFMQHHVYGSDKWLIRKKTVKFDFDKMLKEIVNGLSYYESSDVYRGINIKFWPLDKELPSHKLINYRITVLKEEELIKNVKKYKRKSNNKLWPFKVFNVFGR
jgi:hypothetical protein